jgi:thymidylate synthase (FAD)
MQNSVELIGFYGNDRTHALSAWTSIERELTNEKSMRIGKMLEMLACDGHMTPFEKSSLHFLITTDIATHIQLLKHRIGVNINAESARYKEFKIDKFYIPNDWPEAEKQDLKNHIEESFLKYHACIEKLVSQGISRKRAKESARFYLPYGIQITCDIMFNWRSFAHFQKLRNEEHAQIEIQEIAQKMLALVEETNQFPFTINAMRVANLLPKQ